MTDTETDRSTAESRAAERVATGEGSTSHPSPVAENGHGEASMNTDQMTAAANALLPPVRRAPPASIIKARIEAMKQIHGVGKTGRNSFHNYDYASDFDVLTAVRGPVTESGLYLEMWPEDISEDKFGNMWVRFAMQWQHESGEVAEPVPWYGIANDRDRNGRNGDKWFNKAATAAEKYFFLKQFHIPAGKDFDPDAAAPDQSAAPSGGSSSRKSSDPGLTRGEKTKHGDNKTALQAKLREFIRDVMGASDESELDGVIAGYGAMIEDVRQHFPSWWDGGGPPVRIIERRRKELQAQAIAPPAASEEDHVGMAIRLMRRTKTMEDYRAWKENNRSFAAELSPPELERLNRACESHKGVLVQAPHPEAAQ